MSDINTIKENARTFEGLIPPNSAKLEIHIFTLWMTMAIIILTLKARSVSREKCRS